MKVLFIGGTGIISTACTQLALARGFTSLSAQSRQRQSGAPGGADTSPQTSTIRKPLQRLAINAGMRSWISSRSRRRTSSNASLCFADAPRNMCSSVRPARIKSRSAHYLITESTPLANPFWDYSRNKIACEDRLMRALREESFPMTIVRPSFTYGDTMVPLGFNSWPKTFTAVDRMRRGQPVIVPGDGLTLWTMTHNSDFAKALVGLLGHQSAIGHAFHITSDEVLTWNQIYQAVAEAAGVADRSPCTSLPTSSRLPAGNRSVARR